MRANRPLVTLASNITHSVYAAEALANAGLLKRYLSPVLIGTSSRWPAVLPATTVAGRTFSQVNQLDMKRLWGPELVLRAGRLAPISRAHRARQHSRALDATVRRRMGRPAVLHANTSGLVRTMRAAHQAGALIVADHRDVHPRDHDYVDPLLEGLEEEFSLANWIIVNSPLAGESLADWGVPRDRLVVVPLGVDLDLFRAASGAGEPTKPGDRLTVTFVGSVIRRKGIDLLLSAFSRPDLAGTDLRLCGPTPDADLRERAERMPNVRLLGPLSRNDVVQEYQRADLVVLPSRIDAFGLVAVEALACGTPVVTTAGCGVSRLIEQHGGGFVCAPNDVEALGASIIAVLRDDLRRARLAAQARTAAEAASWGVYQQNLVDWYRGVVLPRFTSTESGIR